jgi:tetratricopeptide (TPR) repeat protein
MAESDYRNFEIHIRSQAADGTYPVSVRVPDEDRRAEGAFRSPYADAEVGRALMWMEQGLFDAAYVEEFGTELFRALFTGAIKEVYDGSRQSSGARLRLRLIIDAPSISQIPWELLYDPEREVFLALEGPFVRGLSSIEPTRPLKSKPPLRILVLDAFPEGVLKVQNQIETAGMRQALSKLARSRRVEIEPLPHATLRKLQNALREAANPEHRRPFHILHFIGHGQHDPVTGRTVLLFEDDQGRIDEVDAQTLVSILQPYDLKLVFLNACQSVHWSALEAARGFAPTLLETGLPAVIGMQVTVLDAVARQFAHDFYDALADNQPVDAALADARRLARGTAMRRKADLGIPVCYLRTQTGQILEFEPTDQIRLTRETWQPWLRERVTPGRVIGGLITLIGLVYTLLGLYGDPRIQEFLFGPGQMTCGTLKIAVAEFGLQDEQGRIVTSEDTRELANSVSDFLVARLGPCVETGDPTAWKIGVWPPSKTRHIRGATPEDRAREAEKLAPKIKADCIIYGNVKAKAGTTEFTPEFYLSESVLQDAVELPGQYEFGKVPTIPASFGSTVARQDLRAALLARAPALAEFTIGLSYFAHDRFEEARDHFEAAAATEGWANADGKELIFLFLGHTAGQLDDLDSAEAYYRYILDELSPEYARAHLSAADILFHRARAGGCEPNAVDAEGLRNAIRGFEDALDARDQPAWSDIATKAAFFQGRAYLCLSQGLVADHWTDAEREFLKVIAEFDGGNQRVKELAAQAHANIGLTYILREDKPDLEASYRRAAEHYHKAIELTRHADSRGLFYLWLAWIHVGMDECDMADEALANADEAYDRSTRTDPAHETFRATVERKVSSCDASVPAPSGS